MALFPELLAQRGAAQPNVLAYRFFEGMGAPRTLTFGELWCRASTLARLMFERGWQGERALLVCRSERHFVVAFHACLMAGVIAVPTAPPRRRQLYERLHLLANDARASAMVCDLDNLKETDVESFFGKLDVLDIRSLPDESGYGFKPERIEGGALAFLQYTSGSTGDPKGVAVTHDNLLANSEVIRSAMGMSAESSVLIALPLFHDMGLVGGVLQSVYVGCATSFMPPAELVQYPERWLERISAFRVTTSGGPNFMYELAARDVKPEAVEGLDLSCWSVAFCGAEPIRANTMSRFIQRFAPAGLSANAFFPCYGMAEATLFIAGKPLHEAPAVAERDGAQVVSCGISGERLDVQIVDPMSRRPMAEGDIGEIWVRGASVASGYWLRDDLTNDVFGAQIEGEGKYRYLRTGDLGWILNGRLYVSGRLKDLIVVNGRNYAPHDIEATTEASCLGVIRQGGTAAFNIDGTGASAQVVVVAELERTAMRRDDAWSRWAASVRSAVRDEHGLIPADVVFIRPGSLPRTSSGKVRRSRCRADYLDGALSPLVAAPL